ncbi:MAG: cytochrome P460 family protein [Candidatus Sulfotelmatobacter sp.]
MTKIPALLLSAFLLLSSAAFLASATPPASGPEYTSDAQLKLPENYRQWVYLTTGFDMSYNPSLSMDHHMFDNVFVNPESYKSFVETGTWPDKTVLVLEGRMGQDKGSINQKGSYQGTEIMGIEAHVKDEARFPGKWAFFIFGNDKTAKMVPTNMECYTCHAQHAAVDTTFVQFYPTLLPIAQKKGTLSSSYEKESAPSQK